MTQREQSEKELLLFNGLLAEERKKPIEYFKHDTDSHRDQALARLVFIAGWEYYGMYWLLVESLYQKENHYYDLRNAYDKNYLMTLYSSVHPTDQHTITCFLESLAEFGLIDEELYNEKQNVMIARVLESAEQIATLAAKKRLGGIKRAKYSA